VKSDAILLAGLLAISIATGWRITTLWSSDGVTELSPPKVAGTQELFVEAPAVKQPVVLARTLFSPQVSKHPAQTPAVQSDDSKGGGRQAALRLVGVVAEGPDRIALISHNGSVSRLREARTIGPWTVVRIDARSATLRNDRTTETLWLDSMLSKGVAAPESQ
jgi:hypothetical protein